MESCIHNGCNNLYNFKHKIHDVLTWNVKRNRLETKRFFPFIKIYLLEFFCILFFKKAKKIHAVERLEYKNLKNYFINNKIITIYHLYNFNYRIEKCKIKKNFIFLGRIAAHKGLDILINSFEKIKHLKNFKLYIYGPIFDKNYFKKLQNLIYEKKLEKTILFKNQLKENKKNIY